ncbi:MAG: hypothetical protein ACK5IP_16825 [Paracoccus sp. (in: a-proteobacteria)]
MKLPDSRPPIGTTLEKEIGETLKVMEQINRNAARVLHATETFARDIGGGQSDSNGDGGDSPTETPPPDEYEQMKKEIVLLVIEEIMPILEAVRGTSSQTRLASDQAMVSELLRRMEDKVALKRGRILTTRK